MNTFLIPTRNDPLGTVREILNTIWEKAQLENMLLPLNGSKNRINPQIIHSKQEIQKFNPFAPIMPINSAQMVPDLLSKGQHVAAVLRPCELRTLPAVLKRESLESRHLLTICIDCLGTLPVDEFEWRALRKGSQKGLTREALQFTRQGGIVPYRYRAACQLCKGPDARHGDININVIGLPVRQYLFIKAKDEYVPLVALDYEKIASNSDLLTQHHRVVTRLEQRGDDTRQRIYNSLYRTIPTNLDSLIDLLEDCGDCKACMQNCPICINALPRQDAYGRYLKEDMISWQVDCSACGICEQHCSKDLPLTLIFGQIRSSLMENSHLNGL